MLGTDSAIAPESVIIDQSNAAMLDVSYIPADIEINRHRTRVLRAVTGFSSFIGSPYVFTSYEDAIRYLGYKPEDSMYIVLRLGAGIDRMQAKQELQKRLPDVDVWTQG